MLADPVLVQVEQHMADLRQSAERHRLVTLARCCTAVESLSAAVRRRLERRSTA